MDNYEALLNELREGTAAQGILEQCSVQGPVAKTKSLIERANDTVKSEKRAWTDGFSKPSTILDGADAAKKLDVATRLEKIQKRLGSETDIDVKSKLIEESEQLMKENSEILSNLVQDRAIKAEIETSGRINTIAGKEHKDFINTAFNKTDDEFIPQVIGNGKKEGFTTEYILNNLEKDIANAGESISPTFNKYYAKAGEEAVSKVVKTAKYFKALGKVADLPEGKFLDSYFPSLTKAVDGMDDMQGALKDLAYVFKDTQEQYKKAFFDYQRTGEFKSDYSVKEAAEIYMNMVQKKVKHRQARDILEQVSLRAEKEGWEARHVKAAHNVVKNMLNTTIPDETVKRIRGIKKTFVRFSLFGNIGSAFNNLTSITTMISPKFGYTNTTKALKTMFSDNAINDFLDDFNIGSADDAVSSYDFQDGINPNSTHFMDWFSQTEQGMTRLSGIAHLIKRFGSTENALLRIQQLDSIADPKARMNGYLELLAPMKKDIAEALFHNKAYDKAPGSDTPMYEVFNSVMTLMRHPIRESKQLFKVASNLAKPTTMTREESIKQLTRYFTAKAMFMGKGAVFFAVPAPIMNLINEKAPELREDIEDITSVLEKVAIFKIIGKKIGVDTELSQYINWAPVMLSDAIQRKQRSPLTQFYEKVIRSASKITAGKGEWEDGIRLFSVAASLPGSLPGTLQLGQFAIGGKQFEKAANAVVDVLRGESEFYQVPKEIKSLEDIYERGARAVFSLTPETAQIVKAKSPDAAGGQRRYITMLATTGKIDEDTFNDMLIAYGGSKTKLKKSLIASIERMKLPRDLRTNARRAISGY